MSEAAATALSVEARARASAGSSAPAIYRMVRTAIAERHTARGVLIDVGCGIGNLWPHVQDLFDRYAGVDVVRYEDFPRQAEFHQADLDAGPLPLPPASGDVVAAVETIEHLENPRAFMRELTRIAKPGGWVVVTTPNQLSLLSKLTLVVKNQFNAFQDSSYPAHLTALLESDLRRMAKECRLTRVAIQYSGAGRMPGTPWHYPGPLSRWLTRSLSDNVLVTGTKPVL